MPARERREILEKVTKYICERLSTPSAVTELLKLGPDGFDWNARVREAARLLIPRLVDIAPTLIQTCEAAFNKVLTLKEHLHNDEINSQLEAALTTCRPKLKLRYARWLEECRTLAREAADTIPHIESQQISAQVQRFLLSEEGLGALIKPNGNSIYPDLLISSFDYSFLPFQSRSSPIPGPCLRNKIAPRPSNVPDGLEIKTNKGNKIKVDAHGAHPGLHLGITWEIKSSRVVILDVLLAYIRIQDYSVSDGRVDVTTKKRSFGHDLFISLITGTK